MLHNGGQIEGELSRIFVLQVEQNQYTLFCIILLCKILYHH